MKTIQQKLSEIRNSYGEVKDIVNNYECGFITITEMHGQLMSTSMQVEAIKTAIKTEYNINDEAISLMLQM